MAKKTNQEQVGKPLSQTLKTKVRLLKQKQLAVKEGEQHLEDVKKALGEPQRTEYHLSNKGYPIVLGAKTHRNDPCHCKSGFKYKNCCMHKDENKFKLA